MSKSSLLPNPPKVFGLSRRVFIAFGLFIVLIIGLFFGFLSHYSSSIKNSHAATMKAPIAQEAAENEIRKIQQRKPAAAINTTVHPSHHAHSAMTLLQEQATLKAANNAAISVYQAPTNSVASNNAVAIANDEKNRAAALSMPKSTIDPYEMQNAQDEKTAFLRANGRLAPTVLDARFNKPLSPDELKAGTIIPATLVTGIQSDLPGNMIAKVRRDVLDTVTGNDVLIPQGTTLIGTYDAKVSYGQSRVLIVWTRLIFPNGTSFNLQGMPGVDLTGMAGLQDQVNHHYFKLFSSALLMSVFGVTGEFVHHQARGDNDDQSPTAIINAAIAQQMSQTATQFIQKNMDIQPTLKIRPGTNFNVLLTRDMVFPHPYFFHRHRSV